MLSADIFFKHSSFSAFTKAYNLNFSNKNLDRSILIEKRITETWFYYKFLIFSKYDMKITLQDFSSPFIKDIDLELEKIRPSLFGRFVSKWSKHKHSEDKHDKNCSLLINIDGNFKCSRMKYLFLGIDIEFKEYKNINIGCFKTPERGSYFCEQHLNCGQRLIF